MKTNNTIYVGNTIRIINPEIIIRIGYEFTFDDAKKEILEKHKEEIYTLLRNAKVSHHSLLDKSWNRVENKIVSALAYDLVRKKMREGNVRQVFTKRRDELMNVEVRVVRKKTARTGTYYPPISSEPSYFGGDYDYEPGGLDKMKTHVIFEFDEPGKWNEKPLLIEQCNVKLVR